MPTPNHPPHPTDGELAILRVLWTKGPSTVRQILPHLPENTRYTTALKLLQIMYEKHLVTRDEQNRTHIYSPAQKPEATQRRILKDLIERARAHGHRTIIAGIDAEQTPSIAIHAKFGFEQVGRLNQVGFKFGRWLDVVYMQLLLPG